MQALDDDRILPLARTTLHDCGGPTPLAVVLLHGFTNHPGQYREFAPMLYERGVNVFIPRMPEQGDRNRMTRRIARLTAESLMERASEALDIGCGLGERVCIAGISSSGLLCAYFAQHRSDVARAIPIAPVFSILKMAHWLSAATAQAMLLLPDMFLWWDPRVKEQQRPSSAYPQFPTHALAQTMRIGDAVWSDSARNPFAARSVVMLTNRHDPAVNNDATNEVIRRWQRRRDGAQLYEFPDLPRNHDIIEPDNPNARTDIVYPRLLDFIMQTP